MPEDFDHGSWDDMKVDQMASATLVANQDVRNRLTDTLWRIGGYACASDLANCMRGFTASELKPVLDAMVYAGSIDYEAPDLAEYHLNGELEAERLKKHLRIYKLGC